MTELDLMEEKTVSKPMEEYSLSELILDTSQESAKEIARRAEDPAAGRTVVAALNSTKNALLQEEARKAEERKEQEEWLAPVMISARSEWRLNGTQLHTVDMGGQEVYALYNPDGGNGGHPTRIGAEWIARIRPGQTPELVQRVHGGRPARTTGQMAIVTDIAPASDEDGWGFLIEAESGGERVVYQATDRVIAQIESGEVDALGGLPISGRVNGKYIWELKQQKGKGEIGGGELRQVSLEDFKGYAETKSIICSEMANHVLRQEPPVLLDTLGIRPQSLKRGRRGCLLLSEPGTGKTFLYLASVGSLRSEVAFRKTRAKLEALRYKAATVGSGALFEAAGRPTIEEAQASLQEALDDQYAGLRKFGDLRVVAPDITKLGEPPVVADQLLEGYKILPALAVRKFHHLTRLVEERKDDFMFPVLRATDYIQPIVGVGLAALNAQLDRARNHDDVAFLLMPESEPLFAKRGHHSRFYTDELVNCINEALDGTSDASNLFVLADGNRADMIDIAIPQRRLKLIMMGNLEHEDRGPVAAAILSRQGLEPEEVDRLTQVLLDLIYAQTKPLVELVMVDDSTVPLSLDHILTPALVESVVESAEGESRMAGRWTLTEDDFAIAWRREMHAQAHRFSEDEVIGLLGLDRKKAAKVVEVRRTSDGVGSRA